jgi:hypothetical protein
LAAAFNTRFSRWGLYSPSLAVAFNTHFSRLAVRVRGVAVGAGKQPGVTFK